MKLKKRTLDCTALTPMFCYGADPRFPEIRSQSIKGAIRFWWRATQPKTSLEELFQKETQLFGGAAEDYTQSPVSIEVIDEEKMVGRSLPKIPFGQGNILANLAYGPVVGGFARNFIAPRSPFKIILRSRDEHLLSLYAELISIVGIMGGIGASSRNGFGRFEVRGMNLQVEDVFRKYSTGPIKTYTGFSKESKLFSLPRTGNWDYILGEIGKAWLHGIKKFSGRGIDYLESPVYKGKESPTGPGLSRHSKGFFFIPEPIREGVFKGYLLHLPYAYLALNPIRDLQHHQKKYKEVHKDFLAQLPPSFKAIHLGT